MLNIRLDGAAPKHVERLAPQMNTDESGTVHWKPSLVDYDASVFFRGKTVTNEDYNTLFLKQVYQGNYITDTLTQLFGKHLNTAVYRTFKNTFHLLPSYIKSFSEEDWGELQEDGYYYITIPASEHGFTQIPERDVLERMNVDTEMYLLGHDGHFYEVQQIDVDVANTVRLYTDDNTLSGFAVIRTNDKAYALAEAYTDATQIRGLAAVATSARYTDLIDIDDEDGPNTRIAANAQQIADIISGETIVGEAQIAQTAQEAQDVTERIGGRLVDEVFVEGSNVVKVAQEAHHAEHATEADYATEATGTLQNTLTDLQAQINTNAPTLENLFKVWPNKSALESCVIDDRVTLTYQDAVYMSDTNQRTRIQDVKSAGGTVYRTILVEGKGPSLGIDHLSATRKLATITSGTISEAALNRCIHTKEIGGGTSAVKSITLSIVNNTEIYYTIRVETFGNVLTYAVQYEIWFKNGIDVALERID